ncbi:hypothetical protein ACN6K9_003001 [Streptomyces sp. SAS_267]|uniref:hypothetical protein n=1 Tax=Streptomyces sp. SAS_267 TaxID=3412750 RepID=UPI00403C51D6
MLLNHTSGLADRLDSSGLPQPRPIDEALAALYRVAMYGRGRRAAVTHGALGPKASRWPRRLRPETWCQPDRAAETTAFASSCTRRR